MLGKLDVDMEKHEIRPVSPTCTKTSFRWLKDIDVKPEILELLGSIGSVL